MATTVDLENIIKPALKEKFEKNKHKWFVKDAYSHRTPKLLKHKCKGKGIVALFKKTYYVSGND